MMFYLRASAVIILNCFKRPHVPCSKLCPALLRSAQTTVPDGRACVMACRHSAWLVKSIQSDPRALYRGRSSPNFAVPLFHSTIPFHRSIPPNQDTRPIVSPK